jgi:RNA polymerase sigma-70 factor (ECF subfamily)
MTWNEITNLVERARAGDRTAYGDLIQRFQPTVYAIALTRLRNAAEAQDLAQEVFVHSMTRLDQLRNPACFPGWLRQITVRMAINRLTRRGPVHGGEQEVLENAAAADRGALDTLVLAEQRTALWHALERLKPLDRATLVAFYIRGRTLKQMGREFETPVGTIKRRLHVARKRLRRQMERSATEPNSPSPVATRPTQPVRRRLRQTAKELVCA